MAIVVASTVDEALAELRRDFDGVDAEADGTNGAYVTVHSLEIGERWAPPAVDVMFHIPFNYPFAAIYPFYTDASLQRADGGAWPNGLQQVEWRGRQVVQISLRANRWQPQFDTAAGAVVQVRHWFRELA